jgi:hypothetical protein
MHTEFWRGNRFGNVQLEDQGGGRIVVGFGISCIAPLGSATTSLVSCLVSQPGSQPVKLVS